MNTRSEGLRIGVPQVSSKADASSSYLTEKERNLGAEILELIKKKWLQLLRNKQSFLCIR